MGGWLNTTNVDFFQFFDVAENVAQLSADFLLFLGSESEARQMGDVFDVDFWSGHGIRLLRIWL